MSTRLGAILSSVIFIVAISIVPAQARAVSDSCRYQYSAKVVVKECYVTYNWFERRILLKQNGMEPVSIRIR